MSLFRRHSAWLESRLADVHAGPTVVITHHAPSRHSIHPRFADSLLNACFVSDAAHLLRADRVSLWIHGHTHDSFDHRVNGTRVVCNPRGYARAGVNENPVSIANFIVEVNELSDPIRSSRGRRRGRRCAADRDRSRSDVSGLLGFAEPSSFSRRHRRQFGMSPRSRARQVAAKA